MKRIYYDATFSVGRYRGMGKYIRQVLGIIQQHGNFEITGLLPAKTDPGADGYIRFGSGLYPVWEQKDLGARIRKDQPELAIFPYNTMPLAQMGSTKKILIVHDLIFLEPFSKLPLAGSWLQKIGRLYRRWNVPRAIRKADVIISVSAHSAAQIRQLGVNKPVYVIPNAVDVAKFGQVAVPPHELYNRRYFFHLGGEAPHKNTITAIRAFEALLKNQSSDLYFYIAGVHDKRIQTTWLSMISDREIRNRVIFMDYLSDDMIVGLYRNAIAFVFSSFLEGFGIPIIESMAAGCPVILSNASVMPEIGGEAVVYFDPADPQELMTQMKRVQELPALRQELVEKGLDRCQLFSTQELESKVKNFIENEC